MKQLNAKLICSAIDINQIPEYKLPEIAFAGRSNVGKSTLINKIVRIPNLAHTSSTPGKTKLLNFFLIENKFILVDLPGFGYASVSKEERIKWTKLNLNYLQNRNNLKLIFSLIDSRHDPSEIDLSIIELLENSGKNYSIVLTKVDKISKKLLEQRIKQISELTKYCQKIIDIVPHSSKTGEGTRQLWGIINKIISSN